MRCSRLTPRRMQVGFAMLEVGSVRVFYVQNILIKVRHAAPLRALQPHDRQRTADSSAEPQLLQVSTCRPSRCDSDCTRFVCTMPH